MSLYDLSDTYVAELTEFQRIKMKGTTRTSGVSYTFNSWSSGTPYTSADGENGVMGLLATALAPFLPTAALWNANADGISVLKQNIKTISMGGMI